MNGLYSLRREARVGVIVLMEFTVRRRFVRVTSLTFQLSVCFLTILRVGFRQLRVEDSRRVLAASEAGEVRSRHQRSVPDQDLAVVFVAAVAV